MKTYTVELEKNGERGWRVQDSFECNGKRAAFSLAKKLTKEKTLKDGWRAWVEVLDHHGDTEGQWVFESGEWEVTF